jgi:hypothetical protein
MELPVGCRKKQLLMMALVIHLLRGRGSIYCQKSSVESNNSERSDLEGTGYFCPF